MTEELSIYQCDQIVREIEAIASQHEGEIPEEDLSRLVQAQTTSLAKLTGLCGFIKFIEHRLELCKMEEERIAKIRKTAETRLKSVEKYVLPYVQSYKDREGHSLSVGTFTLSTHSYEHVEIENPDQFAKDHPSLCITHTEIKPDKITVREKLQAGEHITGADLVKTVSLQLR